MSNIQGRPTRKSAPFSSLPSSEQKEAREKLVVKLQNQRDKDRQLVRARFKNYECNGAELKFPLKLYKEDQVEKYEFKDGEIYSVPLGVIRHVNKTCFNTINRYAVDEKGNPSRIIGQKIQRFEFSPMEFIEDADIEPAGSGILTVENI